jgi:hypothetical protein
MSTPYETEEIPLVEFKVKGRSFTLVRIVDPPQSGWAATYDRPCPTFAKPSLSCSVSNSTNVLLDYLDNLTQDEVQFAITEQAPSGELLLFAFAVWRPEPENKYIDLLSMIEPGFNLQNRSINEGIALLIVRWAFLELFNLDPRSDLSSDTLVNLALPVVVKRQDIEELRSQSTDIQLDQLSSLSPHHIRETRPGYASSGNEWYTSIHFDNEQSGERIYLHFYPQFDVWDAWINRDYGTEKDASEGSPDPITAVLKTGLIIPDDTADEWYDSNVLAFDIEPEVLLNIDTEAYALLQSLTPYLYPDEEFREFISE